MISLDTQWQFLAMGGINIKAALGTSEVEV